MPEPIGNYSPEAVIEAIEENMIDAAVAMGRTENGVVFRGNDVSWVYTGFPALNRVMRAKFTGEEAEDRVAEIAECFRQWHAPVIWVIGPSTWPPQLPEYLKDASFSHSETWMGTAADLSNIPSLSPDSQLRDNQLRVERITHAEQLKAWTLLDTQRWTGDAGSAAINIFSPANTGGDPRCRFYLGYLNDKPVVRGMACVNGDTAGLYWLNTVPEHREAGFDLALASQAMSDARQGGAHLAVMPTPNSQSPLCQKLGFRPYCQFNIYAWPPPPSKAPVC
jgi:hypothetical protein